MKRVFARAERLPADQSYINPILWAAKRFWLALAPTVCYGMDPQGPEVVGGAGVTYYPRPPHLSVVLPSVDGAVIAAFSKVLLPLWLCIVFTAYMFGPAF